MNNFKNIENPRKAQFFVLIILFVMEKKGLVPGLYGVVRRAYTVASFAALSWLVHGGCTACYVISVPLVLCSSLFGTLVFLGVRRTMSAREESYYFFSDLI